MRSQRPKPPAQETAAMSEADRVFAGYLQWARRQEQIGSYAGLDFADRVEVSADLLKPTIAQLWAEHLARRAAGEAVPTPDVEDTAGQRLVQA